eukprot:TRINITY_DN32_c0_g2_i1.p1 TRINITY_DN32_c0_g2~~TRINITY_DN32_c0_g2_i1.p1  ORF type:complete len:492 (-),score=107.37 TRINITY_DN32_c0_g2_i1:93-1532(-)
MKLDVSKLRYLSKEDFRVLTGVEMGMKNHEIVPTQLIAAIAKLKRGGTFKSLTELHKNKLIFHDAKKYDGYKLTYGGYDFLALKALTQRSTIIGVGNQIGVGKESDVFIVYDQENVPMILKIHRLGRISFRAIKDKRDYLKHRKSASWLYLARLAALKEYAYMKVLHDNGFPVPKPVDTNRHCVVMELAKGYPLAQVTKLTNPEKVYSDLMNLIVKFACYGLIHCDFNEFNIMIDDKEQITVIDFPQMVSTSHYNAEMYFNRDVQCIKTLFSKRYGYEGLEYPRLKDFVKEFDLDIQVAASGFDTTMREEFDAMNLGEQLIDGQAGERIEEEEEEEEENGEVPTTITNDGNENSSELKENDDSDEDLSHSQKVEATQKILQQLALDREDAKRASNGRVEKFEEHELPQDGEEGKVVDTKEEEEEKEEARPQKTRQDDVDIRRRVKKGFAKRERSNLKRNVSKQHGKNKKETRINTETWE